VSPSYKGKVGVEVVGWLEGLPEILPHLIFFLMVETLTLRSIHFEEIPYSWGNSTLI
jgi:hypothetical protein